MSDTIADRIQKRLDILGKTPSGAAVEAGLGRSSVRDILLGRSKHSRIDTLRKLSVVLDTSVEYLTGQTDDPEIIEPKGKRDAFDFEISTPRTTLEAGVFRPAKDADNRFSPTDNFIVHPDPRLPGWQPELFILADNSMAGAGWSAGDVLTASHNPSGEIELRNGLFVVVRQEISAVGLVEWSARRVRFQGEHIFLECVPIPSHQMQEMLAPIEMVEELEVNSWSARGGRIISLEGVVGSVVKEIPISLE